MPLSSLEKTYLKSFAKMLTRAEKYTNAEEMYDAHLVLVEVKADKKPESSRQVPIEHGNQRNRWRSLARLVAI